MYATGKYEYMYERTTCKYYACIHPVQTGNIYMYTYLVEIVYKRQILAIYTLYHCTREHKYILVYIVYDAEIAMIYKANVCT